MPGVCGDRPDAGPDGGKPCTNLCLQQVSCPDGGFTTISGTVVTGTNPAWGAPDPVYGALVYVPNAPLKPFDAGVSCDQCAAASGSPLVSVATGPDGRFTLTNVPANVSFPLVVQLGKWRRQVTIPAVATCQVTPLSAGTVRLPRNSSEGDIPLMAIATGQVDPIECVLRKMGLDDAEFTVPSGTGRVRMYQDNGADMPLGSPSDTTLYASTAELNKYDMVLFPCRGSEAPKLATDVANVVSYANGGGRVFATHFSYVWFGDTLSGGRRWPWWPTANWVLNQTYSNNTSPPRPGNSMTAVVNATIPKGPAFQSWLQLVGATTTPGQLTLQAPRWDVNGVVPPTQSWVNTAPPPAGMQVSSKHLTFNTPLPPTDGGTVNQCGRVLFSDFHVNTGNSGGTTFPGACTNTALTAQEKVLEFMLFDLASCIVPDVPPPPTCSALTCASYPGVNCGQQSDGCGGLTANCGTCSAPATCGGGGVAGVCGPVCVPRTCAQLGNPCGPAGDGCGGLLTCATCVAPSSCGGSGTPNVCGAPACTPRTCASFPGVNCGQLGDGCGGLTASCGTCAGGQICGGGGTPNVCGGSCVPLTCAQLGLSCGQGSDGCGGLTALCGTCPSGQWCGGGTGPGLCGNGRNCTPVSCSAQGLNCGPAGDGCGSVIQCGGCTVAGETCGGGSIPGVCGLPACTPRTCAQLGSTCGQAGDGCGRILDCGSCTVTGETCGGGGVPGVCGRPLCTPNTCAGLRFNCGPAGDGCGGLLNCGTCTAPSVCGGLGLPGVCSVQIN